MVAISDVAYVLGMDPHRLHRWYKNCLSGYKEKQENGEVRKYDIAIKDGQYIRVPILEKKNMGNYIGIDEKHINGAYHTVFYNLETSKIILMVKSTKTSEVHKVLSKYFSEEDRYNVEVITKDGAENYDYLARQAFPRAIRVIDKYHVVRDVFDTLDSLRNYLKNKHIIEMETKREESLHKYQVAVKDAKKQGLTPPPKELYQVEEQVLENGDTIKQLLTRSKHLLYKHKDSWNTEQVKRAEILFREFPDIAKIYTQLIKFRSWYSATNLYDQPHKLSSYFDTWLNNLKQFKYAAVDALGKYLKKQKAQILNYFQTGFTNAVAESINRQINKLISKSYGIREIDFFYFRANVYLC